MSGTLFACAANSGKDDGASFDSIGGSRWNLLLQDGDSTLVAPITSVADVNKPTRNCTDCTLEPLAYWTFNSCEATSTQLADEGTSSTISHAAFRSVSTDCTDGVERTAALFDGPDDIVYAPDQPDFVFDAGLTLGAWIKPDRLGGTQSIFRRNFSGSSAFVVALQGSDVVFAVRLANGRAAGLSAPVSATRFTHVAATYDGQTAKLYIDGSLVAQTSLRGAIASGAGPILIGNDVRGRRFSGIIDQVWLNTLAVPADGIAELMCARKPPSVVLTNNDPTPVAPGTVVGYGVSITNNSSSSCPKDGFDWFVTLNSGELMVTQISSYTVSLAPGETANETVQIRSLETTPAGSYTFDASAYDDTVNPQGSGAVLGTYVVDGSSTCVRQRPDVVVSPVNSDPMVAGVPVAYDVSITNRNSASCSYNHFEIDTSFPMPQALNADVPQQFFEIQPGETVHATFKVSTEWSAAPGAYPFDIYVYDIDTWNSVRVHPQYVVGSIAPPPPDALPAPNGLLTASSYSGVLWTSADAVGSTSSLDPARACISGRVVQIPYGADGQPDQSAWGALLGWQFDQPIDVSSDSEIDLGFTGATGLLINLKLAVADANGVTTEYCAPVAPSSTTATNLRDFWTVCSSKSGASTPFDAHTMKPTALEVQVATSLTQAYPFNFCLTNIEFR